MAEAEAAALASAAAGLDVSGSQLTQQLDPMTTGAQLQSLQEQQQQDMAHNQLLSSTQPATPPATRLLASIRAQLAHTELLLSRLQLQQQAGCASGSSKVVLEAEPAFPRVACRDASAVIKYLKKAAAAAGGADKQVRGPTPWFVLFNV